MNCIPNSKVSEYRIFVGNRSSLEETVNELLGKGWVPLGAPFMNDGYYCQAMVKNI